MKIKYIYLWIEQQHHVHWRRHWTPVLSEWLRMHIEYTIYPEEEKEKKKKKKDNGRWPTTDSHTRVRVCASPIDAALLINIIYL